MFRIKICGITNFEDAHAACTARADTLGFNFFSKSRRFVEPQVAGQIARELSTTVNKAGVFVNHTPREIGEIVEAANLDAIQLHGNEPPEVIAELPEVFTVRAWPATSAKLKELVAYLQQCERTGRVPDALLFDALSPTEFGGTGRTANWDELADHRGLFTQYQIVLAGGLTPDNVAQAIAIVRPDGVDTASGVEVAPGRKSAELMNRFVMEAQTALDV